MIIQETTALRKIKALNKRIRIIQGGTSAGKTLGVVVYLIALAQSGKYSISIVSESYPHLKRGAYREFLQVMQDHHYYREEMHNKTDSIYNFETGSYVEFFGADQPDKVRGPRRDVLFINECNNVHYDVYDQLEVRTKNTVLMDFNPVSQFWLHEKVIPDVEHDFLKLTYKDNEALDSSIIRSIESRQHNESWWRVYGLGELGVLEGQIFTNWEVIDLVPAEARLEGYGLDFGYSSDPTACAAIYKLNDGFVLDEMLYEPGLSNQAIASAFKTLPSALVVADSAEPKSIDEIKRHGIHIIGSQKGPDSVSFGIQLVQNQKLYVTKRSTNLIKELRNYTWKLDKNGDSTGKPEHEWSHMMDAARYFLTDLLAPQNKISVIF